MTFRAVRADQTDAGQTVRFVDMEDADLMDGDVTVRVTHSTVNYKDGLALSGKSPIIRSFPMAIGTAGFTAMLALIAIERAGVTPSAGPALVTGAAGGVGSMAISLLADEG